MHTEDSGTGDSRVVLRTLNNVCTNLVHPGHCQATIIIIMTELASPRDGEWCVFNWYALTGLGQADTWFNIELTILYSLE